MREQLQKIVDLLKAFDPDYGWGEINEAIANIEATLSVNPEPAVRLRPGWVCKDVCGIHWFENKPTWDSEWNYTDEISDWAEMAADIGGAFVDPWPDKPSGGPECLMEVR